MNRRQPLAARVVPKTGDHLGAEDLSPLPGAAQKQNVIAAVRRRLAQHLIANGIDIFEMVTPESLHQERIIAGSMHLLRIKEAHREQLPVVEWLIGRTFVNFCRSDKSAFIDLRYMRLAAPAQLTHVMRKAERFFAKRLWEGLMKITVPIVMILASLSLAGCDSSSGSAILGGVAGAAAGGGGYELHLKKQRDRVEADYRDGKIDRTEYEIRIDQLDRDSLLN